MHPQYGTAFNSPTNSTFASFHKALICPEVGVNNDQHGSASPQSVVQYGCHPLAEADWSYIQNHAIPVVDNPLKLEQISHQDFAINWDASVSYVSNVWKVKSDVAASDYIDNKAFANSSSHLMAPSTGSWANMTDSIDMTPGSGPVTATNTDDPTNAGTNMNNIRFRHTSDTKANVLYIDMHVQLHTLNSGAAANASNKTDLIRRNVVVNP